jgi:hypothetical protein
MREVLKRSRALGLKVCLEGSGLAIKQNPVPGSPLKTVQALESEFQTAHVMNWKPVRTIKSPMHLKELIENINIKDRAGD